MQYPQLQYYIALSLIPGVGDIIAKHLVSYIGSAEAIFKERPQILIKIPKIGENIARCITESDTMKRAEKEIEFIDRHNIKAFVYNEDSYPFRLKHCEDSPLILYTKGNCEYNSPKVVAIVGTRNATPYGKEMCKQIVGLLKMHNCIVVSGLAFGIDICAHKLALDMELPTIAVLGHSLETIYPAEHKNIATQIEQKGMLVTEHCSKSLIDKSNFVTRNRIIAGMTDATIIVESGEKGGALITTEYANNYNRDVFAIPGKTTDKFSVGCNNLIKNNKAVLLQSASEIESLLNWDCKKPESKQKKLFPDLTNDESVIMNILNNEENINIDIITARSGLSMNKVSAILLNLEFNGLVKTMPGKCYSLS